MDRKNLNQYILQLLPMALDMVTELTKNFDSLVLDKNEFLLKETKISRFTYFLEAGFIRSFVVDTKGQETTTNIFSPPYFVNDFLSFFKQQPTNENFQTITACKVWRLDFEQVQQLFHNIPEFREFGRMMLVTNYSKLHSRMTGMIKDTAETRYLKLLEEHPDIFHNVPLKIIASFLGITDTSLSRIRKDIASK